MRARLLLRFGWSLVDQAIISAANFLTFAICARLLDVEEFGVFGLGYAAVLLASTLQNALVTQPHNVIGATTRPRDYSRYTSGTAVMQLALAAVFASAALAVAVLTAPADRGVALAVGAMIVTYQIQEFLRRVLYTEGRVRSAAAVDLIAYGGQLPLLLGLLPAVPSAWVAFLGCATASAASALVAVYLTRASFSRPARAVAACLGANLRFGTWLAVAAAAFWASGQAYVFVLAWVGGVAQAAELRAALVVVGPLNVALLAFGVTLPIRFSRAHASSGDEALLSEVRQTLVSIAPVGAVVAIAIMTFASPLARLMVGSRYAGIADPVRVLVAFYALSFLAQIYASALRARRESRSVAWTYLVALAVATPLGIAASVFLGAEGAALGMAGGAGLSVVAARRFLFRRPVGTSAVLVGGVR